MSTHGDGHTKTFKRYVPPPGTRVKLLRIELTTSRNDSVHFFGYLALHSATQLIRRSSPCLVMDNKFPGSPFGASRELTGYFKASHLDTLPKTHHTLPELHDSITVLMVCRPYENANGRS